VFLRENLKLRLMNARLALLSRDGNTFREDMRIGAEWLGRYFDARNAGVESARTDLIELQKSPVGVDLPNLQASLNALRALQSVPERRVETASPAARPASPAKKN
jgi:uroporphyrin-3 C-methyltransferase